jgi:hypothetical protein
MKCEYLITATDGENKKNRQDTINAWASKGGEWWRLYLPKTGRGFFKKRNHLSSGNMSRKHKVNLEVLASIKTAVRSAASVNELGPTARSS